MENWSTNWSEPGWAGTKHSPTLLEPAFYDRNTLDVARELLGKVLVVLHGKRVSAGRIVEVEGYHANGNTYDPASHASRGRTPRCSVMFESPGRAYVYFIYGMYEMLNFVTEPQGIPGAVLIRALEPVGELSRIAKRRKMTPHDLSNPKKILQLANGPGRLCVAMGIHKKHNRTPLQGPHLFVYDDGFKPQKISSSPRVGIREGKNLDWRFFVTGHPCVSPVKENKESRVYEFT